MGATCAGARGRRCAGLCYGRCALWPSDTQGADARSEEGEPQDSRRLEWVRPGDSGRHMLHRAWCAGHQPVARRGRPNGGVGGQAEVRVAHGAEGAQQAAGSRAYRWRHGEVREGWPHGRTGALGHARRPEHPGDVRGGGRRHALRPARLAPEAANGRGRGGSRPSWPRGGAAVCRAGGSILVGGQAWERSCGPSRRHQLAARDVERAAEERSAVVRQAGAVSHRVAGGAAG
mmetsp:Transcript_30504/g.72437  ORF Transcript_30504/g.72437 Transcript_30504/m.72437 type:complete len:232 (-) Transcript_30504:860-1555(-)